MKRKKQVYRFDLTKEIEEIREDAWKNARSLGFERITEIRAAYDRFAHMSYDRARKRGESNLCAALTAILGALDFCRDIDLHLDQMLSARRRNNIAAREAIERIAAEVATHWRAA